MSDKFEVVLIRVENPNKHLALTAFSKGPLADPTIIDGHTNDGTVQMATKGTRMLEC